MTRLAPALQIRPASLADCRAVAELHVASWQAAYAGILDPAFLAGLSVDERETSWREALSRGESELLLSCAGDTVVGFASIGRSRDEDAPPARGEIWALYVHPRSWSVGVGLGLWHAVRDRLQAQGFTSASLWVLERNARAIRFYSSVGFMIEPGSEKDFELGGAMVREVRMVHGSVAYKLAEIHNYRPVDDNLPTSGQPTQAQLAEIANAGFDVVINLALHDDPRYSLPDEAATVRALGLEYVHIPVQFGAPTRENLLAFFDAMDAHRGKKVWVHCAANIRVSAFLGLYRVLRQGWDDDRAFALMRGIWQPNEVWSSFIASALSTRCSSFGAKSSMADPSLPSVESLVAQLTAAGIHLPAVPMHVGSFGDSPELSDELLSLIRAGRKRAGTSLMWAHEAEGEAVPQVGDIELVVDHRKELALVTQVTRVEVKPYREVDSAYAAIEGEGDGSLEYWREAHWAFFSRECERLGREPSEAMPVVCCVFRLLHVL